MLQDQVTFLQDFGTAKQGAANVVETQDAHPEGQEEEGIEIDLSGCNEEQAEQILYASKQLGSMSRISSRRSSAAALAAHLELLVHPHRHAQEPERRNAGTVGGSMRHAPVTSRS